MIVKVKVETDMGKIEAAGFGREDGECSGAPSPKLNQSMRQKRTGHGF